jgi:hypothetical protein
MRHFVLDRAAMCTTRASFEVERTRGDGCEPTANPTPHCNICICVDTQAKAAGANHQKSLTGIIVATRREDSSLKSPLKSLAAMPIRSRAAIGDDRACCPRKNWAFYRSRGRG